MKSYATYPAFVSLPVCLLLSLASPVRAAVDPVADIESQYQAALGQLKKPMASGVLVTEVAPESAAAAGLRAGDIITEYYGTRITNLQTLREQVAEAIARRLTDDATGKRVLLRARRATANGSDEVTLQLPREPLGIRAVEVEAGVPGPRNPPATPRGKLKLNWKQALAALAADEPAGVILRTAEQTAPPDGKVLNGDETLIGWQVCTFSTDNADALTGTLVLYRVDPDDTAAPPDRSTFSFHLRLGDFATSPAFVLDEAGAIYSGAVNSQITATATRVGETLRAEITVAAAGGVSGGNPGNGGKGAPPAGTGDRRAFTTPLNAIVQPAVPWVAAALPHENNAALSLYLVSVRDFLARPGYVLATRGKQPMPALPAAVTTAPAIGKPASPSADGWRVDLMHCGVVIESYWYSDNYALLCTQSDVIRPVITRRVASVEDAAAMLQPRAARRVPTTAPASP